MDYRPIDVADLPAGPFVWDTPAAYVGAASVVQYARLASVQVTAREGAIFKRTFSTSLANDGTRTNPTAVVGDINSAGIEPRTTSGTPTYSYFRLYGVGVAP